ncbi:MAG: hypothetical protein JSV94_01650 [Methanobacteriota archaeon]|nr:MAG: hypothetical protein JSV94_01650 [Euryarchaeota archaeon]
MYITTSKVVRGGGEKIKKCITVAVLTATMLAMAPLVSAGPNGGWGKGLLSETPLLFYVGDADDPAGYMYWYVNSETDELKYDFHGYYLEVGMVYYLIYYDGEPGEDPDDEFDSLGSKVACDYEGVHIKGVESWPEIDGKTICLVPESYVTGSDPWTPSEYQIPKTVISQ